MGAIDWKAAREDAKAASVLIPDGEFSFECVSADAKLSNGGSPQIVADFLCQDAKYSKRTVRNWFTLTLDNPTALDIWFKTMKVFGMGDEYFAKDPDMEDIAERMVGQVVTCSIATDSYNGQDRNKIKFFKKSGPQGAARGKGPVAKGAPAPRPAAKTTAPAPRPAAAKNVAVDEDEEPPF